MEKKYLEVSHNGEKIGAFENVRNFKCDSLDLRLEFDCDDGHIICEKKTVSGEELFVCSEIGIQFNEYKLIGRRTFKKHFGIE